MAASTTLDQVEELAKRLSPQEQLRLMAHLIDRLSQTAFPSVEIQGREHAARVEAFLKMCRENPARQIGEADSAQDIRAIREERTARL